MTIVTFNSGITTNDEHANLLEYERLALAEMDETLMVTGVKWDGDVYMPSFPRHYNERCVPVSYIALDEDNRLMIAGEFTETRSRNELIRSLNQQSVEFRHPQPVNLTPGALGVRCEE